MAELFDCRPCLDPAVLPCPLHDVVGSPAPLRLLPSDLLVGHASLHQPAGPPGARDSRDRGLFRNHDVGVLQFRAERRRLHSVSSIRVQLMSLSVPVHRLERGVLALIPFGIALAFWSSHPNLIIDADTPRYLANSPFRTATYPLFLDLAEGPILLPLQLLLLAQPWPGWQSIRPDSSHGSSVLQWS